MSFIFTSPWIGCGVMAGYAFLVRPAVPGPVRAVLRFFGDHSLEIFLIHQPLIREYNVLVLQRYFPHAGITAESLTLGMAGGLVVTIAISVVLHAALRGLPSMVAPARAVPA
jgi:peptidoglycan/LPS O-acetylase OafA/YrhL